MESFLRLVTLWHSMLVTKAFAKSKLSRLLTWFFASLFFCCPVLTVMYNRFEKMEGKQFSVLDADYVVFHSPYNKVIDVNQDRALTKYRVFTFLSSPRIKM